MATDEEILVIAKAIRRKRKDVRVARLALSAAETNLSTAESRLEEET